MYFRKIVCRQRSAWLSVCKKFPAIFIIICLEKLLLSVISFPQQRLKSPAALETKTRRYVPLTTMQNNTMRQSLPQTHCSQRSVSLGSIHRTKPWSPLSFETNNSLYLAEQMLAPIIVVSLGFADCRCCCGDVCVIPRQGFAAVDLRAKRHGVQSCARSAATRCDSTKKIEQMRALRVGHTMHLHIPSLIYYILYVLSGAQAHRDHAEDDWRASAPWSCLARKRTVIMLKMSGAQAHRGHVWRASAP